MLGYPRKGMTKLFVAVLILGSILATSGCGSISQTFGQYEEVISHLLITQDKKVIIAVGNRHHYIFEAPPVIIKILNTPDLKDIYSELVNFEVDADGHFTGTYKLFLNSRYNLNKPYWDKAVRKAKALGFTPTGYMKLGFAGKISGVRYDAGDVKIPENVVKVKRFYTVLVRKKDSVVNNIPSPLNVTGQTLLYIGLIPVVAPGMGLANYVNGRSLDDNDGTE
jgi:hypothetical protein